MPFLFKHRKNKNETEDKEEEEFLDEDEETGENGKDNSNNLNLTDKGDNCPAKDEEEYEIVEREILPEKMICPDCGGITLKGLEFCDKCGAEL
jgi:hypothetical protein